MPGGIIVFGANGSGKSTIGRETAHISAPPAVRMERIRQRTYEQYGERVRAGGDMYRQNMKFMDFAASRSLSKIEKWTETLSCPVIQIDGTDPISENAERIVREYVSLVV